MFIILLELGLDIVYQQFLVILDQISSQDSVYYLHIKTTYYFLVISEPYDIWRWCPIMTLT